jgi:hypothetical protein
MNQILLYNNSYYIRVSNISKTVKRTSGFQVFRREHSASIRDFVCSSVSWSVDPSVHPHITLNVIFSAVCGRIDLKFGKDFHVDLLFQFLLLFS